MRRPAPEAGTTEGIDWSRSRPVALGGVGLTSVSVSVRVRTDETKLTLELGVTVAGVGSAMVTRGALSSEGLVMGTTGRPLRRPGALLGGTGARDGSNGKVNG